jgi:fibronectin type 3 domain-containing protein
VTLFFSIFSNVTLAATTGYPPSLATGARVTTTVISALSDGDDQNGMGLFDGTTVNEWSSNSVFYWYRSSSFLEVSFPRSVNIWRYGTATWSGYYTQLSILKYNSSDSSYTDVTSMYSLPTSNIDQTQAEKFVQHLPAGRYKFELPSSASGYRLDSEWYVEDDGAGPAVPSSLNITAANGVANLTWAANAESNLQGYFVYQNGVRLFNTPLSGTSYTVGSLTNGTSYSFQISAVDNTGKESELSTAVSVTPVNTNPPSTPIGLTGVAGDGTVSLSWTANQENDLSGYYVYQNGVKLNTTPITVNSFNVTGLTNGVTYSYQVSAANTWGFESTQSSVVNATPISPLPPAPSGLSATTGNQQISLMWNTVSGATGYNVKRSTTSQGTYSVVASNVYEPYYTDTTVTNGTTYYYVVTATNASGDSANSNVVSVTPSPTSLPYPSNLVAIAGDKQVSLTWMAATGASSYNVKRSTSNSGPFVEIATGVADSNYTDTTVAEGTTYYYVVSAIVENIESNNSNSANATPTAPAQGNRAILEIHMMNGQEFEYDLSMDEVNGFIQWYNNRAAGSGPAMYIMNKTYNLGPFTSRKDYLVFDKIQDFEVNQYSK